jgi:hypothetical protein
MRSLARTRCGKKRLFAFSDLVIHQLSLVGAVYRQYDDLWLRSMREVGIRMDFQVMTFPEAFKAAHTGQRQLSSFGWRQ